VEEHHTTRVLPTNKSGLLCHGYSVTFEIENDEGGEILSKRRHVTFMYATKQPGQDYPRNPTVSQVFIDYEDEMDDCICGLKVRKRDKDQVGQNF
jgi:hypothetical protein